MTYGACLELPPGGTDNRCPAAHLLAQLHKKALRFNFSALSFLRSRSAAEADDAGFWPVISRPSLTYVRAT